MTGIEKMNQYMSDVKSGKILANDFVKQAIRRHENDLKRSEKNDPSFPYIFDEKKANKFIAFCEALKQYKDRFKGKPLIMEGWECFIFCNLYGWVHKDTGLRRFRRAFLYVQRKSGKTACAAVPLIYDLLTTPGGEGYCIATKREQAKICFDFAKEMVKQNSALSKRIRIYNSTQRLTNESNASFVSTLASNHNKLDGLGASIAVLDECGAMPNYDLIRVIQSGQGARPEPLLLMITSGNDDLYSAGHQEYVVAKDVLAGIKKDETYFCILYCIPEGVDWRDDKYYVCANPNMGITVPKEWLIQQRDGAINNPALEHEFRCKNLGEWLSNTKAWISPKTWSKAMENTKKFTFDSSKPYYAVCSVDLSKRRDLSSLTFCFYQNEHYFLKHFFFYPLEAMREKMTTDSEMWAKWTEEKYVIGTLGPVIDYTAIFDVIRQQMQEYQISYLLVDPYAASPLYSEFESSAEIIEINQSIKYLSPFVKNFEELIYKEAVVCDNPVMQWMMSHAEVYVDVNSNEKIVKPDGNKDSPLRIDGCVTSAMATGFIKQQLENGEVDLRDDNMRINDLEKMLQGLNL